MPKCSRLLLAGAGLPGHRIVLGILAAATALAMTAGPTMAAVPPVFNNIPATLPGNVSSVGFEATGTTELGDLIELGPGTRASENVPVTILMSIWACQSGGGANCVTTPGATWPQALTLSLYSVDDTAPIPAVGSTLLTVTTIFDLPFRPSFDPSGPCAGKGTGWWSTTDKLCYNGMIHPVTFTLPAGVTLPDEFIWGVSFTTAHYGPGHTGIDGYWNSLNVAVKTFDKPAYGTDVEPDSAFIASANAGTGTFHDDQGGWKDIAPLACFGIDCAIKDPLATPSPTLTITASPTPVASPSAVATESATPFQSIAGATATPFQSLAGATGIGPLITPPTTSSGGTSGSESSPLTALLLCLALGALGLLIARSQGRPSRDRRT